MVEDDDEELVVEAFESSFNCELTFVTPSVLSARAIARPTWSAEAAVPFNVTSPLCACTSIFDAEAESWLSAWSLPLTIVTMTESSVLPVGAPTMLSFVRTIVVPLLRSVWISAGARRHSVMCVVMSELPVLEEARLELLVDVLPLAFIELLLELGLVLEVEDVLLLGCEDATLLLLLLAVVDEPVSAVELVPLRLEEFWPESEVLVLGCAEATLPLPEVEPVAEPLRLEEEFWSCEVELLLALLPLVLLLA